MFSKAFAEYVLYVGKVYEAAYEKRSSKSLKAYGEYDQTIRITYYMVILFTNIDHASKLFI